MELFILVYWVGLFWQIQCVDLMVFDCLGVALFKIEFL